MLCWAEAHRVEEKWSLGAGRYCINCEQYRCLLRSAVDDLDGRGLIPTRNEILSQDTAPRAMPRGGRCWPVAWRPSDSRHQQPPAARSELALGSHRRIRARAPPPSVPPRIEVAPSELATNSNTVAARQHLGYRCRRRPSLPLLSPAPGATFGERRRCCSWASSMPGRPHPQRCRQQQ
jgi:hypothetical protein